MQSLGEAGKAERAKRLAGSGGGDEQRTRRAFRRSGLLGIWEHAGGDIVLERESFDCVDDPSWDLQLVLRDLLRGGEAMMPNMSTVGGRITPWDCR